MGDFLYICFMAVVYQHRRLDNNEIFYIGIGNNIRRAYIGSYAKKIGQKSKWRNSLWNNVVSKTDYIVEILYENISLEEAFTKEKELIKKYGRKDLGVGTLTNLTDGGEGTIGFAPEILERISRKGYKHTKESKQKISIASKLMDRKPHTEESKQKISEKAKGKQKRLGAILSEETRKKISDSNKGKTGFHNKGVSLREETIIKMSENIKIYGLSNGENNGRSKLNEVKVMEIRKRYNDGGITYVQLSKNYNVSPSLISSIITRRTWNHI